MSDPGDIRRQQRRAALDALEAHRRAQALEEESTDAGKADVPACRIRTRPEPVHTATCEHCNNQFWYKKSHGFRVHNGHYASWRVNCGWCDRPQYIPIDENDDITDVRVPSAPRDDDL